MTNKTSLAPQEIGEDVLDDLTALDRRAKMLKYTSIGVGVLGIGTFVAAAITLFVGPDSAAFSDLHVPQVVMDGLSKAQGISPGGKPFDAFASPMANLQEVMSGTFVKIVAILALAVGVMNGVVRGSLASIFTAFWIAGSVFIIPQIVGNVLGVPESETQSVRETVESLLSKHQWSAAVETMKVSDTAQRQYLEGQVAYLNMQDAMRVVTKEEVTKVRNAFVSSPAVATLPQTRWDTLPWKPQLERIYVIETEAFGKAVSPAAELYVQELKEEQDRNRSRATGAMSFGAVSVVIAAAVGMLAYALARRVRRVRDLARPLYRPSGGTRPGADESLLAQDAKPTWATRRESAGKATETPALEQDYGLDGATLVANPILTRATVDSVPELSSGSRAKADLPDMFKTSAGFGGSSGANEKHTD